MDYSELTICYVRDDACWFGILSYIFMFYNTQFKAIVHNIQKLNLYTI